MSTATKCRELGRRKLSLLKKGKTTQIWSIKINKKFKLINMVKEKVVLEVLRHAESKTGLYFGLTLFLHAFLTVFTFISKLSFVGFRKILQVLGEK